MSTQQISVLGHGQKRKFVRDGENERISLPPWLRPRQHEDPDLDQYQQESTSTPITIAEAILNPDLPPEVCSLPEKTSQSSFDESMLDIDPRHSSDSDPLRPPRTCRESDGYMSLGAYLAEAPSCNSVRPPDVLILSDSIPVGIPEIPAFLFHPRPHPLLPQHILDLPFRSVLNRYSRLTKIVDDYQRWHGILVFGFWTEYDLAIAASEVFPLLTEAFNEHRPSVPPHILNTPFHVVLLGAPLLSHLIERYHNDLGYCYFAFYRSDYRDQQSHRIINLDSSQNYLSDSDFEGEDDPIDFSDDI
ncbi:hypothetical protein F4678DRAFT_463737 [Xylaria arbuscula]|nr:hypothetical protein F4678DRAFT_463737 [Xylaria arbuscula]